MQSLQFVPGDLTAEMSRFRWLQCPIQNPELFHQRLHHQYSRLVHKRYVIHPGRL